MNSYDELCRKLDQLRKYMNCVLCGPRKEIKKFHSETQGAYAQFFHVDDEALPGNEHSPEKKLPKLHGDLKNKLRRRLDAARGKEPVFISYSHKDKKFADS